MEASTHAKAVQSLVIVDSSVLIDYLADRVTPETNWLEQNFGRRRIGITTLILTEILQGIRGDDQFAETLGVLERLAIFEVAGRELAVRSARNYRALRKRGITIRNTIDCINATICIHRRYELLHSDRDFDFFEEHLHLEVLHPEPLN